MFNLPKHIPLKTYLDLSNPEEIKKILIVKDENDNVIRVYYCVKRYNEFVGFYCDEKKKHEINRSDPKYLSLY